MVDSNRAKVFTELRALLSRHVGSLTIAEDRSDRYCLTGGCHPTHRTPLPIAWVQMGKAYVSFHHMGVYVRPDLLQGASKALRARMQGKSCFNFTRFDPALFAELEELTVRAFAAFRYAPFMTGDSDRKRAGANAQRRSTGSRPPRPSLPRPSPRRAT